MFFFFISLSLQACCFYLIWRIFKELATLGMGIYYGENTRKNFNDFAEKKVMQINLPFILRLPEKASTSGIECISCSKDSYKFMAFWGVSIKQLHTVLWQPWSSISSEIEQGTLLQSFYQHKGVQIRYPSQWEKIISLRPPPVLVDLGPPPFRVYPLVIFQVRDLVANQKPQENMALVTVIHVADENNSTTGIMAQYFKQANGGVTCLEKIYVSSVGPVEEEPTGQSEGTDLSPRESELLPHKSKITTQESQLTLRGADLTELPYDFPKGEQNIAVEDSSKGSHSTGVLSTYICVVCQHSPLSYALLPCKHACVCKLCFIQLTSCPLCRSPIESYFFFGEKTCTGTYILETKTLSQKVWGFLRDLLAE